jgi:hypothetical protein
MKPGLRLTLPLVGLALVCRLLSLSPPAGLNQPLQVAGLGPRLPAWDHGSIKGEKPRPARPLQRWSKAWNSIALVLDRSHLLSSTLRGLRTILVHPARRAMGHRNRWGLGELPLQPAAQTHDPSNLFPRNYSFQLPN